MKLNTVVLIVLVLPRFSYLVTSMALIDKLNISDVHDSWKTQQFYDILKQTISKIKDPVEIITPSVVSILRAFRMDKYSIKVVILGQDPYPAKGIANGLSFSSFGKNIPASLRVIFAEINRTEDIKKDSADLSDWESQGVFLLNCALTTVIGKSNVHANIWKNFTDYIISEISKCLETKVVYMLWGNFAKGKESLIVKRPNVKILTFSHPSPLISNKLGFKCNHFKEANEFLDTPIKW